MKKNSKKLWVWLIALVMTVSIFPVYAAAGAVENDFAVLETCMGSGVQGLLQKKYESGFGSLDYSGLTSLDKYNKDPQSVDINDCHLVYVLVKASTMSFIYNPSGTLLAVYDKDTGVITPTASYESYYSVSVTGTTVSAVKTDDRAPGISHVSLFFRYDPRGSVTVTKLLDDRSLTVTEAFTFKLTGPDDYDKSETAVPGGTASFTNLKYGDYTLTEEPMAGAAFIGFNGGTDQSLTIAIGEGEGEVRHAVVTATNHVTGKVRIVKENLEGEPLQGAKFRVSDDDDFTDSDGDEVIITGTNGTVESGWLDPGTYYVKELEAPSGYRLDSVPRCVIVPPLGIGTVTFINIPEETPVGSITVTKELETAPDGFTTDAQFTFTLEGDGITRTVTIGVGETGDFGILPLGAYTLYESTVPAHYEFIEFTGYTPGTDGKITVYIGENGSSTVNVTAVNEKTDCHLWIRKANRNDPDHTLPGAVFKLERYEDEAVVETREVTIGEDGMLLNELNPGRWVVTEIEAPDGYILDPVPQTVDMEIYDEVTLTFLNEPRRDTTPTPTPVLPTPTPVKPDMPQTGDGPNLGFLLFLPVAAVFVMTFFAVRRRAHEPKG